MGTEKEGICSMNLLDKIILTMRYQSYIPSVKGIPIDSYYSHHLYRVVNLEIAFRKIL